jgi:hypothetical protein
LTAHLKELAAVLFPPNIRRRIARLIKKASKGTWKRTVVVYPAFVCREWGKNDKKILGQDTWAQSLGKNLESPGSTAQISTPK